MAFNRYELTDFERIIADGFTCSLEQGVLATVQSLADQVGAPEYVRTPQFAKKEGGDLRGPRRDQGRRRNNRRNQELSDDAWDAIRTFEATQLQKSEGIDKSIDQIRKAINKITEKTYAPLSEQMAQELRNVVDNGTPEDTERVSTTLFGIASTNVLVNELCARLYSQLLPEFEFLRAPISNCLDAFAESYKGIICVNPDTDYDGFCSNNKANQNRRSSAKFIIHLLKQSVLDESSVSDMIANIGSYLESKIDDSECEPGVLEELMETVYEMLSVDPATIKDLDGWSDLEDAVRKASRSNVNDTPSLSHRARFKAMDIQDLVR